MKSSVTILDVMQDAALLGKTFRKSLLHGDTWVAWRAFLAALFGLDMDMNAQEIFRARTGRQTLPTGPFGECFVIAGRRSGKSIIAALIAVFLACFKDYSEILAPGETGVLMVLASDRRQCQIIFRYIDAFLSIPVLKSMVIDRYKESISLKNSVKIEVHTSSYRTVRGFTCVGCIADEVAFWSSESSVNPDREVLNAIRPSLATTNGLLLCISSPYGRKGILFESFKQFYGKENDDVLVWKGSSREMNPSLSLAVVAKAYARDYASAHAEYGAEFRTDVEGFLPVDLIESRVVRGRLELPYSSPESYFGFCDPSGGIGDSMTLAIAHLADNKAVLDCVREIRPPFSPESCVDEFVAMLKRYHCFEVVGDRYAGSWPSEQFQKRGILYKPSEKNKSELYLEFLAMVMSEQCELLDNASLVVQLSSLERKITKFGRDSIDHAIGAHDDVGNAVAGVLTLVGASSGGELGLVNLFKRIGTTAAGWFAAKPGEPVAIATLGQVQVRVAGGPPMEAGKPTECPACKSLVIVQAPGALPGIFRCNQCAVNFDSAGNVTSAAAESEICAASQTGRHLWKTIPGQQLKCDCCGLQRFDGQPPNMTGQSRRAHFAPRGSTFPEWDRLNRLR